MVRTIGSGRAVRAATAYPHVGDNDIGGTDRAWLSVTHPGHLGRRHRYSLRNRPVRAAQPFRSKRLPDAGPGHRAGIARSLSPTALLITAVYLGSAEPRRTALAYLAGATVMSLVTGVVLLEILRSTGLSHPAEHGPRYGFRLGLGLLLLVAGA